MKRLAPKYFDRVAEYCYQSWFAVLPPNIDYEDLFDPVVWSNFRGKFKQHDLVRVRADDGSFDVQLVVEHVTTGGINVKVWPHFRASTGMAALTAAEDAARTNEKRVVPFAKDGEPVVRVQHRSATQWRLIGLNGDEVSRNHKTQVEAEEAMAVYLDQINHVLPDKPKQDGVELNETQMEPVEAAVKPDPTPAAKPAAKKSATKRAA